MTTVTEIWESILIVEDSPTWQKTLQQHLSGLGYQVAVADEAQAAIDYLTTNTPDLVLVDIILPRGSGYDVCDYIQGAAHLKHTLVLVMSSRLTPQDRTHATESGAHTYMIKPFSMDDLTLRVNELFDGAPPSSGLLLTRPPPRLSRSPPRMQVEMPSMDALPGLRPGLLPGWKKPT